MRLGNQTGHQHHHVQPQGSPTAGGEALLLARMEIFIIVVAVIAVAAALLLLLLLQIKIKKQSVELSSERRTSREVAVEEIAAHDPNDPYLKNGPPPYREVMKAPERYPLKINLGFSEAKVQTASPLRPVNERSKRTWAQLMTAVLRAEDLVPSIPTEKDTSNSERSNQTHTVSSTNSVGNTKDINSCEITIDGTATCDEVLPSYHEVCSAGMTAVSTTCGRQDTSTETWDQRDTSGKSRGQQDTSGKSRGQQDASRETYAQQDTSRETGGTKVEQCYPPVVYSEQEVKTILSKKSSVFTVSGALQNVLIEAGVRRTRSLPVM